ncbi:MAG: hypothetical protein ACFCUR_04945 [Rhodomicrobiaceae bacterium]
MDAKYHLRAIPKIVLAFLVLTALAAATMHTLSSSANAKVQILTTKTVEKFLDSYPEVRSIAESEAREKGAEIGSSSNQLAAVIAAASDDSVTPKIDSAVRNHGFADAKQWLSIGRSVAHAYAHIKAGGQKSKAQRKVEKAIKRIEKMSFLSDKQKQKLIDNVRKGADDLLQDPPAENVAAVEPMMDQIEKVMH